MGTAPGRSKDWSRDSAPAFGLWLVRGLVEHHPILLISEELKSVLHCLARVLSSGDCVYNLPVPIHAFQQFGDGIAWIAHDEERKQRAYDRIQSFEQMAVTDKVQIF